MNLIFMEILIEKKPFYKIIELQSFKIKFELKNPRERSCRLGDILVDTEVYSATIKDFACRSIELPNNIIPCRFQFLSLNEDLLYLLGKYEVYILKEKSILFKAFNLYRNKDTGEDDGFYLDPVLHTISDFLLLKYESGTICFDLRGNLKWHFRNLYDDHLVSIDSNNVWFENEHINNGEKWAVDISSGLKI